MKAIRLADMGLFLVIYIVANAASTALLVPVTPDLGSTFGYIGTLAMSAIFAVPAFFALNHFWRRRKAD